MGHHFGEHVSVPPVVVTEGVLVQVEREIVLGDAMVRAHDPALNPFVLSSPPSTLNSREVGVSRTLAQRVERYASCGASLPMIIRASLTI